jgi:hypothetical protein
VRLKEVTVATAEADFGADPSVRVVNPKPMMGET